MTDVPLFDPGPPTATAPPTSSEELWVDLHVDVRYQAQINASAIARDVAAERGPRPARDLRRGPVPARAYVDQLHDLIGEHIDSNVAVTVDMLFADSSMIRGERDTVDMEITVPRDQRDAVAALARSLYAPGPVSAVDELAELLARQPRP